MSDSNIQQTRSNRNTEYKDIQRRLANFYQRPLTKALYILAKYYGYTLPRIAKEVFDDELSPQAINKNYFKREDREND